VAAGWPSGRRTNPRLFYNHRPCWTTAPARLLKTLVERYIADGQPVGSRTLSRASGLELSPATIRNVMADLEELGLIASPHTSAGRVPTARGYRLFVDTMLTARRWTSTVTPPEMAAAREQLHPDQPQRVIARRRTCCPACRASWAWSRRRARPACSTTSSSCAWASGACW
jgi:hypothetical protein